MGNTRTTRTRDISIPVYPHTCGEHGGVEIHAGAVDGLSPHVWGTPRPVYYRGIRDRFIPTRVGNTTARLPPRLGPSVYPHTCGEHPAAPVPVDWARGLSPHVWGTRRGSRHVHGAGRFIPTRVGNTRLVVALWRAGAGLSPHVWGTQIANPRNRRGGGLSPHVWGTHSPFSAHFCPKRFIPTRVGNTCLPGRGSQRWTVYPHTCGEHGAVGQVAHVRPRFIPTRVGNTPGTRRRSARTPVYPHTCGEHQHRFERVPAGRGLSPHVWGTPMRTLLGGFRHRFIPTRVGNTPTGRQWPGSGAVYPHTCGEHRDRPADHPRGRGLSPHVWGTRSRTKQQRCHARFIPTRVGNTGLGRSYGALGPVYPHTCGEHKHVQISLLAQNGLSPHVWGTRKASGQRPAGPRFIPTRVGNTPGTRRPCTAEPVYPHTCGEHSLTDFTGVLTNGLSPHVWGTHRTGRAGRPGWRFIPTRVGNTLNISY